MPVYSWSQLPDVIFSPVGLAQIRLHQEAAFRKMADANAWADGKAAWPAVEKAVLPHVVETPLGKVGSMDVIAHAVAFLCSPLACYITGFNLRVDATL